MSKFIFGIVVGVILSTVGFNGVAHMGNRMIGGIQSFSQTVLK